MTNKLNKFHNFRRSCLVEAGGRQGRLVSYKQAKVQYKKLSNLAWGL